MRQIHSDIRADEGACFPSDLLVASASFRSEISREIGSFKRTVILYSVGVNVALASLVVAIVKGLI